MSQRKASTKDRESIPRPHVIDPAAIYYPADLARLFRFTASSLRSERRAGRLRVGSRLERKYVLGAWLLEWFEQGELPQRADNKQKG